MLTFVLHLEMNKESQVAYDKQQTILSSLMNICKSLAIEAEPPSDWNVDKKRQITTVIEENQDKIMKMCLAIEKAVRKISPGKYNT